MPECFFSSRLVKYSAKKVSIRVSGCCMASSDLYQLAIARSQAATTTIGSSTQLALQLYSFVAIAF